MKFRCCAAFGYLLTSLVFSMMAKAAPLVPENWDPALAGDVVMERLITVTAPEVKGAHDAEMVTVGNYAYIVAEVNDLNSGESAAWPQIYSTLSIVNLDSLKLEAILPVARTEQQFENEKLPVGACFVPRIIQKDDNTLRCYFASEQPGKRQSQMWYRDFTVKTRKFAPTIHRVKLKTSSGTYDMQPQHFHADAVAHGFTKPMKDFGMYLFDSFKSFDGATYVALNNFPGKQNALARMHDDFATFEIVGHYNDPQAEQLSESAVNRLPDGSWLAICRNDSGNYHFTTSPDGKTWTTGTERDFVPNGAGSKPTFDKFGDTYYLGWQEATKIHGVHRSVFNIDISRDGKTWERKYRFESTKSFQYPTFREHNGSIWLCATQGDHSKSRKERIMFGKLEPTGSFESQAGKKRAVIPKPAPKTTQLPLKKGETLFTDRNYTLTEAPDFLLGRNFLRTSIEGYTIECTTPGDLYLMTLSKSHSANQGAVLEKYGFKKVDTPEFQLFPGEINRVFAYQKRMESGEQLTIRKMVFPVLGDGIKIKLLTAGSPDKATIKETPEEAEIRIAKMEKIADHALVPPTVNTSPLPKYGYDKLDYGMTIGIERTPKGRLWACWVAGGDSPDAYFVLASSDDDGETWSDPRMVLDSHEDGLGDKRSILVGNLWTDPLGRLWVIFDQSMDMFDGRAGVWATVCDNPDAENPEWSEPKRIWHGVTLNKPTVLSNGEWMLPISLDQRDGFRQFKGCFRNLDPLRGANVFVSKDEGETWERRGAAIFPTPDWHEHMVVERKDGSLWMLARTKKGIMESTSTDAGKTWSEPVESAIKHPVARFFIRRLQSGKLLLIKHGDKIDAHQGRVQLSAWLSDDDGKSWQGGLVLDERKGISYPDGFQAPDGTIYISYDRNRSTDGEILMARFTEEDVAAKQFKGPKSRAKMLISRPLAKEVAALPGFDKPTADVVRTIDLPLVDLSGDKHRHSVVAAGTEAIYQGHCDTVLLPDDKTMFTAWCLGHARWIGPLAKSTDAGLTWSGRLDVPSNWNETSNTPALHRLVSPDGKARLFCFADGLDWSRKGKPPYPMHQSYSEDDGKTWTPMAPNGVEGEVPPKTVLSFEGGKKLLMWSDLPGYVVQSESRDGGLTWSRSRRILRVPDRWAQPCVVESPDGKTLLMLLRENSRKHQSLYSISRDQAETWSAPRELPATLTGDRHVAKFSPDGRLVVAFRDIAHNSPTYGHYVAWVGEYTDIVEGKPGDYRVKLFHNMMRSEPDKPGTGNTDCGYSDLEVLPDGTFIATTYLKYQKGPEKHSVMNTRFQLEETDKLVPENSDKAFTPISNGTDFEGWEQKGNWVIDEEGAFYRKARGGDLIYTKSTVPDDFELRFEWKVSKGCNSGVYYRPGQVEYQVLDNIGSPYGENARQAAASIFFCMAPKRDNTRPVGEWNTGRILCKGSVIEHWLNGEAVISFDYNDPKWAEYVELLDARGGDLTGRGGKIKLQDHGQDVWYRNLRWREIPADETVTPDPDFEPMPVTGAALEKEQARVKRMLEAKK
ncbi:MAG: exo-alpha-sialidase [Verrucomicrobiales bacterium]|nr:exo-alpha-sialidase [Verrucomicrobiales bacterium]